MTVSDKYCNGSNSNGYTHTHTYTHSAAAINHHSSLQVQFGESVWRHNTGHWPLLWSGAVSWYIYALSHAGEFLLLSGALTGGFSEKILPVCLSGNKKRRLFFATPSVFLYTHRRGGEILSPINVIYGEWSEVLETPSHDPKVRQ